MTIGRLALGAAACLVLASGSGAASPPPLQAPGARQDAEPSPGQAPPPASPDEPQGGMSVSAGADLLGASAFVWRGFVLCDSAVAQPNLWVRVGNLTASSWFNAARRGPNGQSLTEHDLTVDYSVPVGGWVLSAGWINYTFVDLDEGRFTNELYAAVSRDGPLSPTLTVYQDVQQGSGTYLGLGVTHEVPVGSGGWSFEPMASLGYNHRLWTEHSGWSDAVFEVDLSIPIAGLAVRPFVAYSLSLDRRIAASRFYWGVGASFERE